MCTTRTRTHTEENISHWFVGTTKAGLNVKFETLTHLGTECRPSQSRSPGKWAEMSSWKTQWRKNTEKYTVNIHEARGEEHLIFNEISGYILQVKRHVRYLLERMALWH